ncbi:MAG: hypothetical protein ACKO96_12585, partial [Flammeovirgaceae bacterium]
EAMTADEYVNGLTKVLLEQGAPAADLFMRQYAEAGLDLTPLRKVILEANHGERQKVEVNIHPQNKEVIDFLRNSVFISYIFSSLKLTRFSLDK